MNSIMKQRNLALSLLDWHGGQSSGVYAVGSTMLADYQGGKVYDPKNHKGHTESPHALRMAISELRDLKKDAKHPEAVTPKDEAICSGLADRLEKLL